MDCKVYCVYHLTKNGIDCALYVVTIAKLPGQSKLVPEERVVLLQQAEGVVDYVYECLLHPLQVWVLHQQYEIVSIMSTYRRGLPEIGHNGLQVTGIPAAVVDAFGKGTCRAGSSTIVAI